VTPSETTTLPTIGWIGLGQMGHRMARHVAEAGYPMIVADAAKTDLAPKGAKIAGSNGEVGEQAEIVVLSVPDGTASLAVCRDLITAKPRALSLVIDSSTIGMKAAGEAHAPISTRRFQAGLPARKPHRFPSSSAAASPWSSV